MNIGSQTTWGDGLVSGGRAGIWMLPLRGVHTCQVLVCTGKSSKIYLASSIDSPSFMFILSEILLAQEWDSPGKESIFLLSEAQAAHLGTGRNMCLVNLLENNHCLPLLTDV